MANTGENIDTIIVIDSDDEVDNFTRSGNEASTNNFLIKEECSSEAQMCDNCIREFQDLKEHYSSTAGCFFPLTERYWYKTHDEKQLCRICNKELQDALMLKRHCFDSEQCRNMYIIFYTEKIACREKSADDADVKFVCSSTVVTSEISNVAQESPVVTVTSEINNAAQDVPALRNAGDNCQGMNLNLPPAVAGSCQSEAEYLSTTASVVLAGSCDSNDNQRHQVYPGNLQNTTCEGCGKQFESDIHRKQHLAASAKCSSRTKVQTDIRNSIKRKQRTSNPSSSVSSSSKQKETHPEANLDNNNEYYSYPATSRGYLGKKDTEKTGRILSVVKHSVNATATNNAEIRSNSTSAGRPSGSATVTNNTDSRSISPSVATNSTESSKPHSRKVFQCAKCSHDCKTEDELLVHVVKHVTCFSHYETLPDSSKAYVSYCFKCKRNFTSSLMCRRHTCVGLVKHQCAQCPKVFPTLYRLRNHESRKHR